MPRKRSSQVGDLHFRSLFSPQLQVSSSITLLVLLVLRVLRVLVRVLLVLVLVLLVLVLLFEANEFLH